MKLSVKSIKEPLPIGKTEAIFFDDEIPGFGLLEIGCQFDELVKLGWENTRSCQ